MPAFLEQFWTTLSVRSTIDVLRNHSAADVAFLLFGYIFTVVIFPWLYLRCTKIGREARKLRGSEVLLLLSMLRQGSLKDTELEPFAKHRGLIPPDPQDTSKKFSGFQFDLLKGWSVDPDAARALRYRLRELRPR